MKWWKKALAAAGCLLLALLVAIAVVYLGGRAEGPGTIVGAALPEAAVEDRRLRQRDALQGVLRDEAPSDDAPSAQILFGDLHVHTTFSMDAFVLSLPMLGGEGSHPPADACDFARYCSALDFFALTDHAEALTPAHYQQSKEIVRQCNALAGDPENPDLVAYMGWEWTQVGATPETHYGHKNVIFPGIEDDELPTRSIAARGLARQAMGQNVNLPMDKVLAVPLRDFQGRQRYKDLVSFVREVQRTQECPDDVPTRELPPDCQEIADNPRELFEKLDQWGFDSLVIPHGTTWGFYTPPGYDYDKQIRTEQDDPARQRLLEVYSGHGNSEEYRDWRAVEVGEDGALRCPAPTDDFEPCCWRAGELMRERCGAIPEAECEAKVELARQHYVDWGVTGHLSLPGVTVEQWQGCGQCRDCFNPAFNYRPGGSAQYILARGNFDDPSSPKHATLGLMASSDNHKARPGTGYKEVDRVLMSEATAVHSEHDRALIMWPPDDPTAPSRPATAEETRRYPTHRRVDIERQASFFMTGGLVAVHSEGRDRQAIWDALKRREVYGTSGDRILLWFDLLNDTTSPPTRHPMGSALTTTQRPRFSVRAVGAFKQKPGCPEWTDKGLTAERVADLCHGECYHPGDERHRIVAIEVVRVRRQQHPDEAIGPLIQDAWRTFQCPDDPRGCVVTFDDPDFLKDQGEVVYYVRALQETTPAVNAQNLRCGDGPCDTLKPCYGDFRTRRDDDCLAPNQERAWSSPIYVTYAPTDTPTPGTLDDSPEATGAPTEGASREGTSAGDDVTGGP